MTATSAGDESGDQAIADAELTEVVAPESVPPAEPSFETSSEFVEEAWLDAEFIEAGVSVEDPEATGAAESDSEPAAEDSQGESRESESQVSAADLQRLHAEYSNYRKRVERDRELVRERAVEGVLVELLPLLDDIERARDHDELVGGFRSVGEALAAVVSRFGLVAFGTVGEGFDPTQHEALMREDREGVSEPTVVSVLQVGYQMNGRVIRPARVSVAGTD